MSRVLNTDTLLGAVGLTASVVFLITSYRLSESVFLLPGDAPPFLVPQLFLYILLVISTAILIGGVLRGGVQVDLQNWMAIFGCIVIIMLATALMRPLGFLVVTPLAVWLSVFMLGYRSHLLNLSVSVGVVSALYLLLARFAQMPLPTIPGLGI